MTAKPEDITDYKTVLEWLETQDLKTCQLMAFRSALRVLPLSFQAYQSEIAPEIKSDLTLQSFRAMLISSVARKYPTDEMINKAANSAADSAYSAARSSTNADGLSAVHAAANSVRAAVRTGLSAGLSAAASAAASAASADSAADSAAWQVVRSNAIFAATHGATKLMSQPLFPSIAGPEEAFDLQGMVLGVLRSFENSDAFKANHWGVWTAWYENQLNDTSRSLFNAEQEKKIALQPDEFWEGGAKDVNAEIAEIVGWPWEKKERIFVSYSTVDEQDARWMVDALDGQNIESFCQFRDIRPGANFVREMQAGLDSCDRLIAVLSPDYEESDHCQAEWASFYNKDPSGRKRLLLPMRVKLGKLNSLASQIVYTDLVFKKGEDRISAFLDAVMQGTRPSPYTYGWTKTGVIAVTGGGMDTPFVTQNRDVKDLSDRLDATREYAKKLAARINSGALQINKNYATKLEGYADALPENADGNIYLADTMARGVRRDINSDIDAGYLPDSAINDFVGLLELHSGICPYFPQLTNFYEDVKTGALSDPLPIEAILAAEAFVSDHTPDTFDESVSRGFENLDTEDVDALGRDQSIDEPTTSKEHRVLSQDPVDGADPEREMLQAKAHALEELDRTFKKVEKTADYAERVSKVGEKFGAIVRPVLDLLKTFGDGGL